MKLRNVDLYHFSWLSIISKAVLLIDNEDIHDNEQAYILNELVRYLNHDYSGVTIFTRMHADWSKVCRLKQQGTTLTKGSEILENTVASWQQLLKFLSIELSMKIRQPVDVYLTRARKKDVGLSFQEDCNQLVGESFLSAEFYIPNAAANISITADFLRKIIKISMRLDAPKDKSMATASINWLTRQLKYKDLTKDVIMTAHWPKRISETTNKIPNIIENPKVLIPENVRELPTSFELSRIIVLNTRFKGVKTFVEDATREFPLFYNDVGQHLSKWVAKAPKVKEPKVKKSSVTNIISKDSEIDPSIEIGDMHDD